MPEGHTVTLPRERRVATTCVRANLATTLRAAFIVTVHGAVPMHRHDVYTNAGVVSTALGFGERVFARGSRLPTSVLQSRGSARGLARVKTASVLA